MKKTLLLAGAILFSFLSQAQLTPEITSWLQDTVTTGTYYVSGNSNAISNNILVNCQRVEYSANSVYITATGVPSYATGPFLDGNPSQASNQNAIFQFPRNPVQNTGTPTATLSGNIGVFVNGVALFDYRDGVAWNSSTNALCGGPGNPPCPGGPMAIQDWNRDAIPAEMAGFDCSKGHPAMGNYHHHQNPSAFKLDLTVISTICNLYDADGLYMIDSNKHSPLICYAYDGFPIYGAYAYRDTNGTGGVVRMKSGYTLRNITTRTTSPTGGSVSSGPAVNATYFLGYFREDYEFAANSTTDYLDEHNGRFCVTPEYPNGTYAYFATVDSNWISAYPYAVGPTFYGAYANRKVTSINEPTTRYIAIGTGVSDFDLNDLGLSIFPNPSSDLIAIQMGGLVEENISIDLIDMSGKEIASTKINKGSSIAYFDVQAVYAGTYLLRFTTESGKSKVKKVIISKE
ncbi:MAG: YHYH protein [Flavobacteriales bacterium]|nr:YHYH protein [Flavobacteriales bacterium]